MASEILGLFTTPEQYQQAQRQAQEAQAIQYANLDPRSQAQYGFYRAGQQLGNAIGGALGGEDPQLKLISQRQQILGMIDPTNPDTYAQGIQMALQTGDTQTAYLLRNEMMKSTQQAQELKRQAQQEKLQGYQVEDIVTQRDMATQTRLRQAKANELFGQLKDDKGIINEQVKNQLLSFQEGRDLISAQAKVQPDLRKVLGIVSEVNPFQRFLDDPNAPAFIKNSAQQLKNSFDAGVYNEEQIDKYVTRLDEAMGRVEPKDPSFGAEAERKSKRLFGKRYSALNQQEAAVVDQAVEASEKARVPSAPVINMTVQNQMQKGFGENLTETITSNIKAGRLARPILGAVDSMQILLDEGVRTGFGQETMMQVGKVGQVFNPDFNIKGLAGQEALQSIATNLVLPQVKQLGVNPTDTDLKFINTGSPSLSKTVAGNKLMLSALRLKGERDQDLSRFTNTWLSQNTKLTTTNPTEAFVKFNSDFDTYTQSSPLYAPSASKLREQFNALGSTTQKGGSKPEARNATDRGGLTKPKP
jgi:hypothetical protein